MSEDIEDLVYRMIERFMASRYTERHGLVTSYDPKTYMAKVAFMPEGQESGWLPIETGHIGNSYGIAHGLQPGDGKATGDQVVIRYQEGDFESGKIVQRVHSEGDQPPEVQSGETMLWTRFKNSSGGANAAEGGQGGDGQRIYFKNDGSITQTDGNGATMTFDGKGNIVFTCKAFTVGASDDIKLISVTNALLKGASAILYGTANVFLKAANAINAKAASNLADPPWVTGAQDPPIDG